MTGLQRRVFLLATFLVAATATGNEAASGFHSERLASIDAVIDAEIDAGKIAGAVALVARNGTIAYHKSFGYADLDSRTPMRNDAIFRIASMTKAVTSVGVMILYERGHFLLNDPVSRFIPEFAEPEVAVAFDEDGNVTETRPASREISILDLLSHSSGITYKFLGDALARSYEKADVIEGLTVRDVTLEQGMRRLATQPLLFDPGDGFAYGLNTDLLGYLCLLYTSDAADELT